MKILATLMCAMFAMSNLSALSQDSWIAGLEGTWVVDGARGSDVGVSVSINREAGALVLKTTFNGREIVTRYDLTGADATNTSLGSGPQAIYRTRIEERKLVTQIWTGKAEGAPQNIETRYLESPDVMVIELARAPGGPVFNRTQLRRKAR
ncbi:MAG: hypothetical protein WCQ64_15970 [Acidobacteriota bacterium]